MRIRLLCLALLVAVACRGEKKIAAPAVTPPTEAEAQKFVEAYVDAMQTPNVQRASQLIDWEMLLERSTRTDAVDNERWRRNYIAGALQSQNSLAQGIVKTVQTGGRIAPLRVRSVNGERRALLRLILPDGSINYHEMPLVRDAAGFVRARDIYIYAGGEYLSDIFRRFYLIAAASDPSLLDQLAGKKRSNVLLVAAPQVQQMAAKARDGDGQGAIEIYRKLPAEVRHDKSIMVVYAMAAGQVGDDRVYARALDELRAAFPTDRGLEMIFIDGHLLAGRYDEALRSIDHLEEAIGGDPYLDTLRAGVCLKEGNLEQAERFAVRACERAPELEDAWWTRVTVALAQKDFAEIARVLTHLRDGLGVTIGDLTQHPEYAEFVRTAEYRKFAP